MQKKYFIIENMVFSAMIAIIYGVGMFLAIGFTTITTILFILWCLLWCIPFVIAYKTKMGSPEIEPNVFHVSNAEVYLENISHYLKSEQLTIYQNDEERVSYFLSKKKGLDIRVLLVYLKHFDKETYKNRKKRANLYINKKNNIPQYTNIYAPRRVRINIIIVDECNEYTENVVHVNATDLFTRVEAILNIVVYRRSGIIKIPAHFGLYGLYDYNKVWNILRKTYEKTEGRLV